MSSVSQIMMGGIIACLVALIVLIIVIMSKNARPDVVDREVERGEEQREYHGNRNTGFIENTRVNPPSVHHAAWVKCVSTQDKGDDSLLEVPGDSYKDAWITCRNSV